MIAFVNVARLYEGNGVAKISYLTASEMSPDGPFEPDGDDVPDVCWSDIPLREIGNSTDHAVAIAANRSGFSAKRHKIMTPDRNDFLRLLVAKHLASAGIADQWVLLYKKLMNRRYKNEEIDSKLIVYVNDVCLP